MPCDYEKYHPEWFSRIRPDILKRSMNRCEECGVLNYSVGYRDKKWKFYDVESILIRLENNGYDIFEHELKGIGSDEKPIKIILTVAHLDHDINNNDYSNLKALCQLHHNRYDVKHRKETRLKNKGLQELF